MFTKAVMKPFCGHEGASLLQMTGRPRPNSGHSPWLWDKGEAIYLHYARTGIALTKALLGLVPGDEILVPSYNCGAEIDPLIQSGLCVTFYRTCKNGSIDLEDLSDRINHRTKAIYVIHYFGFPQEAERVRQICVQSNLFLIEDCALSLLTWDSSGKRLGTYGDISFFSFVKFLPVPDGGMLVINNPAIISRTLCLEHPRIKNVASKILPILKSEMLFALSRSQILYPLYDLLLKSFTRWKLAIEVQTSARFNGMPMMLPYQFFSKDLFCKKMSGLSRRMLETFDVDQIIRRRRQNFIALAALTVTIPGVRLLFDNLPEGVCPLALPLIVEKRDKLVKQLNSQAIDAITWWRGYHPTFSWEGFPEARFLKDNLMTLPVHSGLNEQSIAYMAKVLRSLIKQANS